MINHDLIELIKTIGTILISAANELEDKPKNNISYSTKLDSNTNSNTSNNRKPIIDIKKSINNRSGISGIYYYSHADRWIVRPTIRGKRIYVGCYGTKESAEKALRRALVEA